MVPVPPEQRCSPGARSARANFTREAIISGLVFFPPAETKRKATAGESTDEKTGGAGWGAAGKNTHTNPGILKQEGRIKKKPEAAEIDVKVGE